MPHLQWLDAVLPAPSASDRLDLYDPARDQLLTFVGYDQPPHPRAVASFPNELWSVPLEGGLPGEANAEAAPPADLPFGSYWGRAALTPDSRHIYLTGPFGTLSVLVAALDDSGHVGPWRATTPLPDTPAQRRSLHQVQVIADHLMVLGGWFQDGEPALRDIHVAAIDDDGGLGAFRRLESTLPIEGGGFSAARCGSHLFVARGAEVWSAKILAGPDLSPFTRVAHDGHMDHVSYGQTAMACDDNALVVVDVPRTHLFEIGPGGTLGAVTHLEHPSTFPQSEHGPIYPCRSVFVRDSEIWITTSHGGQVARWVR